MKRWYNTTIARIIIPIFLIGGVISLLSEKFIEKIFEKQLFDLDRKEIKAASEKYYGIVKNRYEVLFFNYGENKKSFLALEDSVKQETIRDLKSISKTQPYAFYIYDGKEFISIYKKNRDFNLSRLDLNTTEGSLNNNRYAIKEFIPWGWKLIILNDNVMLDAIIAANKKVIILVVLAVALLVSIVAFVVLYRALNIPFRKIFEQLDAIKKGKYKNIKLTKASEEIKSLASHINNMSNELQNRSQENQKLIDRLYKEKLYAKNILDSQTGMVIVTNGETIIDCNKSFLDFLNRYNSVEEFKKHYNCICDLFENHNDEEQKYLKRNDCAWVKQAAQKEQRAIIAKNGQKKHFKVNAKKFLYDESIIYVATFDDITDIVAQKEELKNRLYTDPLTKLPNRRKLLLDMVGIDSPVLFIINIDSFSEINDLYGYKIGDELLILLAKKLSRAISLFGKLYSFDKAPSDWMLYKLASDEYALLISEAPTKKEQEKIAYSLCHLVDNSHFPCQGVDIEIKITIGASDSDKIVLDDWDKAKNILSDADMALKKAKKDGLQYMFYEDGMNIKHDYTQNIKFAKKIKDAIANNRIVPYFQPIMDVQRNTITKFESLIRLIDEDGTVITPNQFLTIAKSSKQYESLTRIIIQKSFDYFADKPYEFSVNLSYEDITNHNTVNFIYDLLSNYNSPEKATFELLESENIKNYEEVKKFVDKVSALGAKCAIDDFGSGYSSFEHILKLRVDYLKIDGSIIKNIDKDPGAEVIAKAIVSFAKDLKIKVVGEFVHSEEVFNKIAALGIEYAQGYFISPPKPNAA